jgi:hypothetical protein
MIIASDFVLTPFLNVKLVDTLVFASAFAFGYRIGAYVGMLSEFIWSLVSPYGMGLYVMPFLVGGELLYAFAGYYASKIWGRGNVSILSSENLYFGAILAICAFIWDFETNLATGLLAGARTLSGYLIFEVSGIPFMIPHEISDFVLGSFLAPLVILYFSRMLGGKKLVFRSQIESPRMETR